MKTWILCADNLCAKIYQMKNPSDEAHLCYTIPHIKNKKKNSNQSTQGFIRYLAEEIEIACGAGTESSLILCAEREFLSKIYKRLSESVKHVIIGSIEEDLCPSPDTRVSDLCHRVFESREYTVTA